MARFHGGAASDVWSKALTNYAKTKDPSSLPSDVLLAYDDQTITIYDAFQKAQYHALVLPRIPFHSKVTASPSSQPAPSLGAEKGKLTLGVSKSGQVPSAHLRSLRDLLASPHASEVLSSLRTASRTAIQLLQDHMRRDHNDCVWPIRTGFHAIPSMETVHLHVISSDLVSDRLKHKKHYQSFHPTHGFWLELSEVETYVTEGRKSLPHSDSHYEALLRSPLVSFRDGQTHANIPKLKSHLLSEFQHQLDAHTKSASDDLVGQKRKRESY